MFVRGDWFFLCLTFVVTLFMAKPYIYAVQQDNYRLSQLRRSKRCLTSYLVDLAATAAFAAVWGGFWFIPSKAFYGFVAVLFFFVTEFALYFAETSPSKKKPLKFTRRAIRLDFAVAIVCTLVLAALIALVNSIAPATYWKEAVYFALPPTFPAWFALALTLMSPVEKLNNRRYELRAKRILQSRSDLIVVGITGSMGKTSVKNYLAKMLENRFSVLKTPESYNTPLGIARTLNGLDATHEVFIAEMGARRKGDIKRLMKIVNPSLTILTSINNQHLETFGSIENTIKEKMHAVDMLQKNGTAIVNTTCLQYLSPEAVIKKTVLSAGLKTVGDNVSDEAYCLASDLAVCVDGTAFALELGGKTVQLSTALLGKHNVEDIALAAAAATVLGASVEDIALAVKQLEPVEHRLQLVDSGGIKIIDDTFNANPDGARAALEVLAMFEGRKVVLTPGMVELGAKQNDENYLLGKEIASVADLTVLIGAKQTAYVYRGLIDEGYEKSAIVVFQSLAEAKASFNRFLHAGDVLLMLNDLPDIYDE